ncbi:MAG: extracellular solute-binding protein, partial [bacterium]
SGLYLAAPSVGGDIPLVVDSKPYMDPEYLEDVSWCQDSMQPYDKVILWPTDVGFTEPLMINVEMAEEAGVDWEKYRDEGWTIEEFREAAEALTKDVDGDGEIDQWGYGNALEYWRGGMEGFMHSAGVRSSSFAFWQWGNEVDWDQPGFAEWLETYRAMVQDDHSIPEEALALPKQQSGHELWFNGQVAMTLGYPQLLAEMQEWNRKIDSGEVVGEKIDWEAALLPPPRWPPHDSVTPLRCGGISVFKQEPYKGDEHTRHAEEVAKYLSSPANLKSYTDYATVLPSRLSLVSDSEALADARVRPFIEWAMRHAVCAFPMGHPTNAYFRMTLHNKYFIDVMQGKISGADAVAAMKEEMTGYTSQWVAENPEMAEVWEEPWRDDWPVCYFTPGSAYPQGVNPEDFLE